ncbi:MAG: polysaccharide biosynthesis/export family protein [Myxococcales bacterium]|nr:polysaccharide biosynthesis/export family protein [Myxococcales bacterium]
MAISIPARGILIGVLLAAWAALGGGCASNAVDTREVYERYGAQIGAFDGEGATDPSDKDYRIGAQDVLSITVVGEPELTKQVRVPDSGVISFPLIGDVTVSNRTVRELEEHLAARLEEKYLRAPQVNVLLVEYREAYCLLLGEVNSPGPYKITRGERLMEMLGKARGFTALADTSDVRILRRGTNRRDEVIVVDTDDIIEEGQLEANVPIYAGDIIVVPERFF